MTIQEIQGSSPAFRATLQKAVDDKNIKLILAAAKLEVARRTGVAPAQRPGQSYESALSHWHTFLHGMQTTIQIIEGIGKEPVNHMPEPEPELPHEHAIPPHLVEARKKGFKMEW